MVEKHPYDNLWENIPSHAFIALGRRGREQISLYQCFTPGCLENNLEHLHILAPPKKSIESSNEGSSVQKLDYKIQCDACNSIFHLVFEQFLDVSSKISPKPTVDIENTPDSQVVFENVYATDESGSQNYGQIGFVQVK
ncbi:MAG: hypothetical protein ACTSWC_08835 [Promethearchaeota archaeon]